jgi:hypothetical protein
VEEVCSDSVSRYGIPSNDAIKNIREALIKSTVQQPMYQEIPAFE